jgi:hypothetical protein
MFRVRWRTYQMTDFENDRFNDVCGYHSKFFWENLFSGPRRSWPVIRIICRERILNRPHRRSMWIDFGSRFRLVDTIPGIKRLETFKNGE